MLVVCGAGAAVLLLSAQAAASAFPVRVETVALGAVGLVIWWAGDQARKLLRKVEAIVDRFPRVEAALWGTPDPEGNRSGGLVDDVAEVKESLREMQRPQNARTRQGDTR